MSETPTQDAGRELDALIEERVFGREVKWLPTALSPSQPHSVDSGTAFGWNYVRLYSTDIAAAWRVVEEMARRGWSVDVQNRYAPTWACHVWMPGTPARKVFEHEATAPLAICKAALASVEAPAHV